MQFLRHIGGKSKREKPRTKWNKADNGIMEEYYQKDS